MRDEWVPDTHVHRLADANPVAARRRPGHGRQPADVQRRHRGVDRASRPRRSRASTATARATRSSTSTAAAACCARCSGAVPFRERTTSSSRAGRRTRFELPRAGSSSGSASTRPARSRRPTATATATASCSSTPRSRSATSTRRPSWRPTTSAASSTLTVRVRDGYQRYVLDRHPFDVVGWDGYVWPYTFNADDFEPRAGRFHLPPPAHQTFQGPNFVICTFAPRMLDWDPRGGPAALPPLEHPVRGGHVLRRRATTPRARAWTSARLTLHPSGLPHGPQPGAVEKALGAKRTDELAVMWDTFRPLRLTDALARPRRARVRAVVEPGPRAGGALMFEEAQLYSPVTEDEDGVTVHLADSHPGADDPDYLARRGEIAAAALAWEAGAPAPAIGYTEAEQEVWRTVSRELAPKHEALCLPCLPRGRGRAGAPAGPHSPARGGEHRAGAADRLPLPARRRARAAGRVLRRAGRPHLPLHPVHPPPRRAPLHPRARPDPRGDRPRQPARLAGACRAEPARRARPRAGPRPTPA